MEHKEKIKNYMKLKHVSYADLASALGVSRQRIWTLLNKPGTMTVATLERISKALGVDISEL